MDEAQSEFTAHASGIFLERIATLTRERDEALAERDAAMETAREVAKHTARFMTAIGGIYASINMDLETGNE